MLINIKKGHKRIVTKRPNLTRTQKTSQVSIQRVKVATFVQREREQGLKSTVGRCPDTLRERSVAPGTLSFRGKHSKAIKPSMYSNYSKSSLTGGKLQPKAPVVTETRVGSVPITTWQDDRLPKRCPANKLLLFRGPVCL